MQTFRVFHSLQKAHSALFRAADHKLRQTEGITTSQNAVLFILAKENGIPMSSIAKQLKMSKSSLSALIDRMVALGYLRRKKDEGDGRINLIFIETLGAEVIERTYSAIRDVNGRLLDPFNGAERDTIKRFLAHIAANADEIVNGQSKVTKHTKE